MKAHICIGTALAQVLFTAAAYGQASPASLTPPAVPTVDAQVEDIVVTANRREQRLQDVPISVTALSANELARSAVTNTFQLSQTIPSLNVTRANTAVQPTIRGVGTRSAAPGDESNVAVYLDGVYQPTMAAGAFNLLNIDRVEVLRGPQGTLFGRNSTGGLINVITSDPGRTFVARGVVSYGSYDAKTLQGYVSGPLGETLSANLTALWYKDDGYLHDISRGNALTSGREDVSVRSKLLFRPAPGTDFKLTLGYFRTADPSGLNVAPFNGNTAARSLANNPAVIIPTNPRDVAPTLVDDAALKQYSAAFEAKFDLGGLSLQSTSSYQHNRGGGTVDSDGTPLFVGVATTSHTEISRYFTQEVRLLSTGSGPFQWIAGAFYFNGRGQFDPVQSITPAATIAIYSNQLAKSYAGFGEGTYKITPAFSVTVGARYTSEARTFTGMTQRNGVLLVSGGIAQQVDQHTRFGQWTYRASAQYEISPRVNVYASYSRGFKSGVFNTFSTNPLAGATKPETLDSFEIGLKSDPVRWLRLNLSAFHYNYKDIQLSARDAATNLVILLNAASARTWGAEAELTVAPTRHLNLRAYGTLLDAKYTSFPNAQIFTPIYQDQSAIGRSAVTPIGNLQSLADESGRDMIRAPHYTFGVSGDYTVETNVGNFTFTSSLYNTGRFYWDPNNRLAQPSYTLVNASLGWATKNDHFGVSVWVKNLTNATIYQSLVGTATADIVTYDPPRTIGVTGKFNF